MRTVMSLAQVDPELGTGLLEVGGKALNLGILTRAGFPVPIGFCVTTSAYRAVVGDRLDGLIDELAEIPVDDRAGVVRLAELARRTILDLPVPADIAEAVRAGLRALGEDVPVAVRSSATAEDLPFSSFAGQQDTYLNVVGASAVVDAVRDCWASLWTDRAVTYRMTTGIDHGGVALAVVVQQMVEAAVAGVMFTADPVTGTRHHIVIDASPGLGESVVSGAVNPDHFVVDARSGAVLEQRTGDKAVAIRSRPGGGTERIRVEDADSSSCLTQAQLRELAELAVRVQDHYQSPQDTEWAIDADDRLWLTQARPITTLYPLVTRPDAPANRVFLCITLAQGLTRPLTPMGLATFRLLGSSVMRIYGRAPADPREGPPAMRTAGMRLFMDATEALRHPLGRRIMLAALGVMEARAAAVLRFLGDSTADFAVRRNASPVPLGHAVGRVLWRTKAPLRLVAGLLSPRLAYRGVTRLERRLRAQLELPPTATPLQRLDHVERLLGTEVFLLMPRGVGYAAGGFVMLGVASRVLRGIVRPGELSVVLRGLPHNVTSEMDLKLWELGARLRGNGQAFSATDLKEFLDEYGHRAVAEIDIGMPRWSDDPEHLLAIIRNYHRLPEGALTPAAQFAAGQAEGTAMLADLVDRAGRRSRVRAAVAGFALGRARALCGLREAPKFLLVLCLAKLRAQLRAIGMELARSGRIATAEDVFFLDFAEVRRALGGESFTDRVAEQRAAYDQELRRRHIPRLLLSDGTEPETRLVPTDAPEGALVGSPASTGTVSGLARVVLDPVGAHLEPGEILVAPSTDPGWTPLFLTAGGLVMEMGGSNSHGAVVAREYGIPAVVGVRDVTRSLRSGQLITVDGAAGLVTVAKPE